MRSYNHIGILLRIPQQTKETRLRDTEFVTEAAKLPRPMWTGPLGSSAGHLEQKGVSIQKGMLDEGSSKAPLKAPRVPSGLI